MKKQKKRHFIAILILISGFFLSGCWSGTEVDDLAIINILGIDVNDQGDFELTVRVVKPQEVYSRGTNSGGAEANYRPVIETGKGQTIVEAMSDLSQRVSNRIYLGHVQMVVLGERIARQNLQEALDFLTRENHFRPNIQLLITNGKAKPILSVKPRLETTLGAELNSFIKNTKYHPSKMILDVTKFLEAFTSEASDPYTGLIRLENQNNHDKNSLMNKKDQETQGDQQKRTNKIDVQNDEDKLVVSGTAVFKENGLVGFLDHKETIGFLWVKGKVANDIVVLKCQKGQKGKISLKISDTQSRMTSKIVNGKPMIDETIKVNADIRQVTCDNSTLSAKQINDINERLKKKVSNDVTQVLNKVKRGWQADIFGFGEAIYKKYPDEWKALAPGWRQGELRDLKVKVHVDANISNYGLVKNPSMKR